MAGTPVDADSHIRRMLILALLLAVLTVSRDMPAGSASGLELLAMKLRWSVAWAGLQVDSPFTPLAAHLAMTIDPGRQSSLGQQAATILARHGSISNRLRWSAKLARSDRRYLPLFVKAVQAALASTDCRLLRAAVRTARTLPKGDREAVAREFGRHRLAHWGPTAPRAGLRVSNQPQLRLALTRLKQRPTTWGKVAPCAM
jgi:hypothetical protein